MAGVSISLNNIQNIKTVNLEGVGVIRVRRLGSGEELDLSSRIRRSAQILEELTAIDFTGLDTKDPDELKKVNTIVKRAEKLSDELDEIKRFEFDTYKRCLSDESGGRVVDLIMNTLTDEERGLFLKEVFSTPKQVNAPVALEVDTGADEVAEDV